MILTCNSCEKKFVVPDQAITPTGRIVQCGSCGNKWRQFPEQITKGKLADFKKSENKKIVTIGKTTKTKRKKIKKVREINLYSPEYLQKKHGINLNNINADKTLRTDKSVSFGFYNSLIVFIIFIIILSRGLYFLQDFITLKLPFTQFYLDYFFETIRNMFEIWKNLITNY